MIGKDKLREILKQSGLEIEPSDDDFDKSFADIGLDSLDVFSLFGEIEVVFGKSLSEDEYSRVETLNDVINYLNS